MSKAHIEAFARVLVQQVRDAAISNCDINLRPTAASVVAERWREAEGKGRDELLKSVIADAVDATIFQLLYAIDEGRLAMSIRFEDGTISDLAEEGEGEMAGWYMGSGGWRAMFSSERYVDDFSDLA